ncbi:MAG: 4Fe-4S dicluster domain-containing protein [Candidatus Coatesbacteria bacterium]
MNGTIGEVADPKLLSEIRAFGRFDTDACFTCGTCALACELARDALLLPRRAIRLVQLGLRESVRGSLDPWLCHYCGDCSERCPRQAEPGESLMTLRKYLSAQYDWTGLTALFYRSRAWRLAALGIVASVVAALGLWFHWRILKGDVDISTFFVLGRSHSVGLIQRYDTWLVAALAALVASNVARLVFFAIRDVRGEGISMRAWGRSLGVFLWHFFTQSWIKDCGKAHLGRWIKHLLLVSGFVVMFVLVVFFLPWFQTDAILPWTHPQRLLGYYATAVLTVVSIDILLGRRRKREEAHRFSEFGDRLFPVLILLTALTGLVTHVARYLDWPLTTCATFAVHLMVSVAMLAVEVPFGKLAHEAYRPVAIMLYEVREEARRRQAAVPG